MIWVALAAALWFFGVAIFGMLFLLYRIRLERRRKGQRRPNRACCLRVPPDVWKKPDPFIYSQSYLLSQGLMIRLDNPDIWLEDRNVPGVPLSHRPIVGQTYDLVARVWNGSFEAPAFRVLVKFFASHAGTAHQPRLLGGRDIPVLQVRGFPPAIVRIPFAMPATNLVSFIVELVYVDDANPRNNIGSSLYVPIAVLLGQNTPLPILVYNAGGTQRRARFAVAGYEPLGLQTHPVVAGLKAEIPAQPQRRTENMTDALFRSQLERRAEVVREANRRTLVELPPGWDLRIPTEPLEVQPAQAHELSIPLTVSPSVAPGSYRLTIGAFDDENVLFGGATYVVDVGKAQREP